MVPYKKKFHYFLGVIFGKTIFRLVFISVRTRPSKRNIAFKHPFVSDIEIDTSTIHFVTKLNHRPNSPKLDIHPVHGTFS